MKKLVLVLAIVFAGVLSANAQVWVGGGLGADIQKDYTKFNIAPEVGYMINDQWTVALGANYTFRDLVTKTNTLYLEPYVRYTGGTIGHKFFLIADLCGEFNLLDAKGYAVMVKPGIAWQATEKFTAAFRLGEVGFDHGMYGLNNGFHMRADLCAPSIRIYYNL